MASPSPPLPDTLVRGYLAFLAAWLGHSAKFAASRASSERFVARAFYSEAEVGSHLVPPVPAKHRRSFTAMGYCKFSTRRGQVESFFGETTETNPSGVWRFLFLSPAVQAVTAQSWAKKRSPAMAATGLTNPVDHSGQWDHSGGISN